MLSSCQYVLRVWLLRMIFVSSLQLSCSLKGDVYCILLQPHLAYLNPLFALSRNTLKLVLGSELCDLMVGRGQNLQVISPPQDFLTMTQTRRPARLRVGALSVSYKITGLLKSLLSLLSGYPRLRGRQILLLLHSLSVNSCVPKWANKRVWEGEGKKRINILSVPKKGVAGSRRQSWWPRQGLSEDSESETTPSL